MAHKTLSDFRTELWLARSERDRYAESIADRWDKLKDRETRGILMRDALGDVVRGWTPYRKVHDLLYGKVSGSTVSSIGTAVASMVPGFKRRLILSGISMLLGKVIGDVPGKPSGILSSVASGIGGLARFFSGNKKTETAQAAAEVDA
ncbi:MAG: hypothetical protein IPO17_15580 [Flavobacteriales bacterium]|nr:hypothetical protein [Flavobacteriales bacterium]